MAYCRNKKALGEKIGDAKTIGAVLAKTMLVTCVLRAYADIEKQVHANQMAWKHAGFTWSGFSVGTKETAGKKEKVEDMFFKVRG